MLCEKCNTNVPPHSKYCNICGPEVGQNNSYSNNNITNLGNMHFGENINVVTNYYGSDNQELVQYEKADQRILRSPKKIVKWSLLLGVISIIGNIASIGSVFGLSLTTLELPNWLKIISWIVVFIGLAIGFIAIELRINKNTKIPTGKGNFMYLDLIENNEVLISNNVITDCPICPGTVFVRRLIENNKSYYVGICSHNPQHVFTFDSTTMTGSRLHL
ncbi:hypothetical protein [Paenibacillus agilis]|uniref:Uncharacterized protein n=1 Tax=Paenibacillus agilis TaxID=3020863 RepID=A0A559IW23_9BACL|nr:hypothetical protein [Paenibacillus agilis]TVX91829.1 hypothetical protein FPZ44_01390 [Paenibacillus agilis]